MNPNDVSDLLAQFLPTRKFNGANCHNVDPTLFDERGPEEENDTWKRRLGRAQFHCRTCPLQTDCRAEAKEHNATGIWAGEVHKWNPKSKHTR
ncbi:WhiB family transcriptional regulator [Corynebacterium sp. S7]